MELKIDLLEKGKKSRSRVVLGVFFFVISCAYICIKIFDQEHIRVFDWFYFAVFAMNGVVHFFGGLGIPVERFFGKAHILINSELISFKPSIYKKEQTVYWNDIKSIDYKPNKFRIERRDDTIVIMSLSEIDYSLKNEIKDVIGCIAKEKNIGLNI